MDGGQGASGLLGHGVTEAGQTELTLRGVSWGVSASFLEER